MSGIPSASGVRKLPTEPTRKITISISIPAGDPTNNILLRFAPTWTDILSVGGRNGMSSWPPKDRTQTLHRVLVQATGSLPREPQPVSLDVYYTGEPPRLAVVGLPRPDILSQSILSTRSVGAFWKTLQAGFPRAAESLVDEYARRQYAVNHLPPEVRPAAEFFCKLDTATYWPLIREMGDEETATLLQEAANYLAHRSTLRAAHHRAGTQFRHCDLDEHYAKHLQKVEAILFPLLPKQCGALDEERFGYFFWAFVTGMIPALNTKGNTHGRPNSANFFCFAELAFALGRLGKERHIWKQTVPTLVTASQVFAHLYWSGKARWTDSYRPEHMMLNGQFDKARWDALLHQMISCRSLPGRAAHASQVARRREYHVATVFGQTLAHALGDRVSANPVGGILVGSKPEQTIKLGALASDADKLPYLDIDGDLKTLFDNFTGKVAAHSECTVGEDPAEWNQTIKAHILDEIHPNVEPVGKHKLGNFKDYSRQTGLGWDTGAIGGAYFEVKKSDDVVAYFGCEIVDDEPLDELKLDPQYEFPPATT